MCCTRWSKHFALSFGIDQDWLYQNQCYYLDEESRYHQSLKPKHMLIMGHQQSNALTIYDKFIVKHVSMVWLEYQMSK